MLRNKFITLNSVGLYPFTTGYELTLPRKLCISILTLLFGSSPSNWVTFFSKTAIQLSYSSSLYTQSYPSWMNLLYSSVS